MTITIAPFNKNIAQVWTAGLISLLLISGPFMVGFISLVTSWENYNENLLVLFFRQKQGSFLMLMLLGTLCWYLPRIISKNYLLSIINPYLFKQLSIVLVVNLFLHSLFYILPVSSPAGNLIQLINFILWTFFWARIGYVFYPSPQVRVWNSPLTISYFFMAAIFMGFAILLFFPNLDTNSIKIWLVLFLMLDLILLMAHFKYVGHHSVVTAKTARLYFTRYLLFFVLRVLFGLIIPLFYIFLNSFFSGYPIQMISPALLLAQIAKIVLFFFPVYLEIPTDAPATDEQKAEGE